MRLNRYLASCGLTSRRGADTLIETGRVTVNGKRIRELATFVEPGKDRVEVDGKRATMPRDHVYFLLHKPLGVVTTARDPEGRPTVLNLVPNYPRVFPVGRLDQDTSGAILLTNDGDLAHRIQHPRYHLEKEYRALVRGVPGPAELEALRGGILLPGEERATAPAQVEIKERRPGRTVLTLIIHEGRHRQVRRMLESVGSEVLELHRLRIGPLRLDRLGMGDYRELKADEVEALRGAVHAVPRPPRVRRPRPRPVEREEPPSRAGRPDRVRTARPDRGGAARPDRDRVARPDRGRATGRPETPRTRAPRPKISRATDTQPKSDRAPRSDRPPRPDRGGRSRRKPPGQKSPRRKGPGGKPAGGKPPRRGR